MKVNTKTMSKKAAAKRLVVIAQCPTPKDISKADSKRPQYSVKDKKRLAKYAMRHGMTSKEVEIGTRGTVSISQAYGWVKDLKDGRLKLGNSVAVSRS